MNRPPRFRSSSTEPAPTSEWDDDTSSVDDVAPFVAPEREPIRASMRPPLREESPADRAARRAAEIRGDLGGELDEGPDEFFVDQKDIPDGWTYEWKRAVVGGAEDPAYQVSLRRMGWEPVPANRHPAYMPKNMSDGVIERKGMVLMERPKEITEEVKANEIKKARNQVRQQKQKIQQSADNQFERRGVKISTGYEPLEVPD